MPRKEFSISKNLRTNERIKVREVRLIDENGEQLGLMFARDALAIARQRGLDLVEVAPNAVPPVCRLMDYGRYKYDQEKRDREGRKAQKAIGLKEVRLRPKIDIHDLVTKSRIAQKFLEEGHKVKFTVLFRGREMAHPDIARGILDRVAQELAASASVDQPPKLEGRTMTMILAAGHKPPKKKTEEPREVSQTVE